MQKMYYILLIVCLIIAGLSTSDDTAAFYVDMTGKDVNTTAQARLKELKESLSAQLNDNNCAALYVPWSDTALDPHKYSKHAHYLDDFHNTIIEKLTPIINAAVKKAKAGEVRAHDECGILYNEIMEHLLHGRNLLEVHGLITLRDTEERLLGHLKNKDVKDGRHAVLLAWPDGSGKSTAMARLYELAAEALGPDLWIIVRFCGATARSTTVYEVLASLCCQLCWLLQLEHDLAAYDIYQMINCFQQLLREAAQKGKYVVIILDGLEQFHRSNPDLSDILVEWLGEKMPWTVQVYISYVASPTTSDLFQALKGKIKPKANLIPAPKLTESDAKNFLTTHLNQNKRKLMSDQEKTVLHTFRFDSNLLLLRLLTEEALKWTSTFQSQVMAKNVKSLEGCIQYLFNQMEKEFGVDIIGPVCRYLNSAWHGLSEMELLDVLSCNNALLHRTLRTPAPNTPLYFPHSLWSRVASPTHG